MCQKSGKIRTSATGRSFSCFSEFSCFILLLSFFFSFLPFCMSEVLVTVFDFDFGKCLVNLVFILCISIV